ncbi:gliding motility-associated ABC transporter substrate-binding protein GldG [Sphingobacterium yanglingense]|uniref:Protein involved in gliding motility GldG n=1 Tax=Sphingobacterium yanglingense TaxID=1437280 RepID=A0A4R6WPQ2_9SPHI|nr:gliding motility-associated ABC transporter substrate-binding protein GldG [Sphingobacterium yanglingense]TDQ81220.1 protein involved in gliding motility GldG [Sphingobacterium yanglingense]
MLSIYKKEIAGYFNSLIGYLAIGIFLLTTGLLVWVFPETSILDAGYTSLDSFFALAPYLLLFLVPAICMRSIAGEKSDGTFELLQSRPITLSQIVIGKFLGGITIVSLAILPTIVYAVTIYFLAYPVGNMDIGAIIGSYIGLLFLAATFVAISIFCSALTNNPIIAFLLAISLSFLFFYGFDALSSLTLFLPIEDFVKNIGILAHYDSISRGIITAADLIYFLSAQALFLLLSIGHLGRQFRPRKKTFTAYFSFLILITVLNQTLILQAFGRIDLTADRRFTLTEVSKDIVSDLKEETYITIFLDGSLPAGFKRLRQAAIDMAHDLKSYSKGKLKINVIDPSAGSQEEQKEYTEALIARGLYPTNLSVKTENGFTQKLIFPSAIISRGDHEINVSLLQNKTGQTPEQVLNNSIQNLEYAFTSAISKSNIDKVPYIAFTEGHGEPSDLELYDAMQTLGASGQVGRLHLDSIPLNNLKEISLLIIAKPQTAFSESEKYKLDYFVRHGGSVIWAIDQIDASLDHLKKNGTQPLIGRELNLDDQLFLYGARLNYNILVDLNCAQIPLSIGSIGGQTQIEMVPWYFFPILMPTGNNAILKNLDGIRAEFVGTIDTIAAAGIKKEILLHSSPFSRIVNTPGPISLQMVEEQPDPAKFRTTPKPVAVLLSGRFPYIYQNRPTPIGATEAIDLSNISEEARMMVIADGDWLMNQVNSKDQSPYPLGWDRYTEQQYANKIFLENSVDYLMNDERLISLRNREIKLRLLDQAMVKGDKLKWQLINVVLPIIILILIGLSQAYLRRHRYTK